MAAGTAAAGFAAVGAAATGSIAGFLSVAGGVLAGVGAITGKDSISKIAGYMSLAGGLGMGISALGAAGSAGSAGAAAAEGAAGGAADLGELGINTALSTGSKAAAPADALAQANTAANESSIAQRAGMSAGAEGSAAESGQIAADAASKESILSRLQATPGAPVEAKQVLDPLKSGQNKLAELGRDMSSAELAKLKEEADAKANGVMVGVGDFLRNNKELVSMGGNALASMYGTQAQQLDLRKSIYNRQMANLNAPVKLGFGSR